jgi:lipoprotein-anchoring transpeptidase ErfK/SrfK
MCQMRIPLGRVALLVFGMAVPMAAAAAQDQGPCAQIRAACQGAGFIQGAAREGIGLQIHCIMPIMQASAQPLTARKPLPKVNPRLVADCKAMNVRFGHPPGSPAAAFPQPLPASPTLSGLPNPNGNPAPASGARVQAVPYPGQDNAGPDNAYRPPMPMAQAQQQAVISALPPEDQPEIGPVKSMPPQFRRTIVDYWSKEPGGTIIIDTAHTYLYLVLGKGKAMRYGIGVGREGFTWSGAEKVTRMAEWPDWHPPEEMIERQPYLPRFMAGGEGNPLGARALYLGQTLYRIHGTNQPSTIGTFVSSGCIRLTNEDITDLYSRVQVGTRVVVLPGKEPSATPTRQRSKAVTAEKPAAKPTSSGLPQVSSPQASPSPAAPAQASTVKNEAVSDESVTSAPPAEQWAE